MILILLQGAEDTISNTAGKEVTNKKTDSIKHNDVEQNVSTSQKSSISETVIHRDESAVKLVNAFVKDTSTKKTEKHEEVDKIVIDSDVRDKSVLIKDLASENAVEKSYDKTTETAEWTSESNMSIKTFYAAKPPEIEGVIQIKQINDDSAGENMGGNKPKRNKSVIAKHSKLHQQDINSNTIQVASGNVDKDVTHPSELGKKVTLIKVDNSSFQDKDKVSVDCQRPQQSPPAEASAKAETTTRNRRKRKATRVPYDKKVDNTSYQINAEVSADSQKCHQSPAAEVSAKVETTFTRSRRKRKATPLTERRKALLEYFALDGEYGLDLDEEKDVYGEVEVDDPKDKDFTPSVVVEFIPDGDIIIVQPSKSIQIILFSNLL